MGDWGMPFIIHIVFGNLHVENIFRILRRHVRQASIRSVSLLKPVSIATAKSSCRRMQRTMSYLARLLGTGNLQVITCLEITALPNFGAPNINSRGQATCLISTKFGERSLKKNPPFLVRQGTCQVGCRISVHG